VDRRNEQKMRELPFEAKTFTAHDFVCHDRFGIYKRHEPLPPMEPRERDGVQLLRNNVQFYNRLLAVDNLQLKIGAKVILLKNLDLKSDQRLVNGSVGTIIRWAAGPHEVDYDSLGGVGGGGLQPGSPAPASPSKQPERASALEHQETYVKMWLKDHATDVPIVRGGVPGAFTVLC
jgi:hypothetical protein